MAKLSDRETERDRDRERDVQMMYVHGKIARRRVHVCVYDCSTPARRL